MQKLTLLDVEYAQRIERTLYNLTPELYDAVCDRYPLETTLPILVANGMVRAITLNQYLRIFDPAEIRINQFLAARRSHLAPV